MTEALLLLAILALYFTFLAAHEQSINDPIGGHHGPEHLKPPTDQQIPRVQPRSRSLRPSPPPERPCPACSRPMRRTTAHGSGMPAPALRCDACNLTIYPGAHA